MVELFPLRVLTYFVLDDVSDKIYIYPSIREAYSLNKHYILKYVHSFLRFLLSTEYLHRSPKSLVVNALFPKQPQQRVILLWR